MPTEFIDSQHYGVFTTSATLTSNTGKMVRQSELTLAALRAAGVFDNMVDSTVAPTTDKLWLDKNIDPAVLKEWDATGSAWTPVTFARLFGRAIVTALAAPTGTADALVVAQPLPFMNNRLYSLTPTLDNTGAATIQVTGVGTYPVRYADGLDIGVREFTAGNSTILLFTGTAFVVLFSMAGINQTADDVADALSQFRDGYLGAFADDTAATAAPGDRVEGQRYFNTTSGSWRIWHSGGWQADDPAIADGSITTPKIANEAVTEAKLAPALADQINNSTLYNERGRFDIRRYGAAPAKTAVENRAALDAAIVAADTAGGGTVFIPREINWGFIQTDETTYPDTSATVNDVKVQSESDNPDGYTSAGAKQGWQDWKFFNTPQTSPAGQHNGNGEIISANWHPYFWGNWAGGYVDYGGGAGGRDADYNYRVSYFTGLRGAAVWQWGQGVTQQGNLPDVELLDFNLLGYGPAGVEYYPLIVDYTNGAAVYGLGTSGPQAAHHFHKPATVTGFAHTTHSMDDAGGDYTHIIQKGITYDSTRDIIWRLSATNFTLEFPDLGNALQIARNSRAIVTGGNLTVNGALSKTSGTFDIPHPDPAKADTHRLRHSFVESPTRGDNIYRFTVAIEVSPDYGGGEDIELPDYWPHLNENPQVWVNAADCFGSGYGKVSDDGRLLKVKVRGESGTYNVLLIGTRCDEIAKKNFDPLGVEYEVSGEG